MASEEEKKAVEYQDKPEAAEATKPDASSEFLSEIIGNSVVVKLNSGLEYHGKLQSVDGYMNIALESTKEYFEKQMKNDYGDVFIRGNNVLYISAA
ncbi:U6 snRNA-associated Sm-like protein LSm6 [Trichomonascus vanleenenianus]|uniref:U4/U6-U5 snRNP complex subunit LSM6 n=1 Tax=Trichomonascus vanleenenianus TaxID=2268995 RepID=UPI003EC9D531